MDELESAVQSLKLLPEYSEAEACISKIMQALDHEELDQDKTAKLLVEHGILPELGRRLKASKENQECTVKLIAEIGKTEEARVHCVNEGLVPPLLTLLSPTNIPVCIQSCRALGNICFDNDSARNAIQSQGGMSQLVELLRSQLDSTAEGSSRLRVVACGLLLNLTNTHESLQEKSLSLGVLHVLDQYMCTHHEDEAVVQMVLACIGSLADSDVGHAKLAESQVAVTIGSLLGEDSLADVRDTIVDLLANLAENDEVKVQLAHSDLSQWLISLLKEMVYADHDEDTQHLEKLAADLLVLLLTGDASMDALYAEGQGQVYKESLTWLTSSKEHLQISGALAIGNIARNDDHCLHLVQSGITEKLLCLLEGGNNGADGSPTLQHAVLSALRNLAIPAANKPLMLECRLIERVLHLISGDFSSVHFKLLGTLRLAIDGQTSAATVLGSKTSFLDRLMEWCTKEDHAGVKAEANRLVAMLVKHSRCPAVMVRLLQHGAIPHLVSMASSEHAVMQNEALVALTVLASLIREQATESFCQSDLVPTLKVLLTDSNTLDEILCNTLTLVRTISKADDLKKLLIVAEVPSILKQLQKHTATIVQKEAKEASTCLEKG